MNDGFLFCCLEPAIGLGKNTLCDDLYHDALAGHVHGVEGPILHTPKLNSDVSCLMFRALCYFTWIQTQEKSITQSRDPILHGALEHH